MTSYKYKSFDFFFYINLHIICNLRLKNDQLNTNLLNFKNSRLGLMFSPSGIGGDLSRFWLFCSETQLCGLAVF